ALAPLYTAYAKVRDYPTRTFSRADAADPSEDAHVRAVCCRRLAGPSMGFVELPDNRMRWAPVPHRGPGRVGLQAGRQCGSACVAPASRHGIRPPLAWEVDRSARTDFTSRCRRVNCRPEASAAHPELHPSMPSPIWPKCRRRRCRSLSIPTRASAIAAPSSWHGLARDASVLDCRCFNCGRSLDPPAPNRSLSANLGAIAVPEEGRYIPAALFIFTFLLGQHGASILERDIAALRQPNGLPHAASRRSRPRQRLRHTCAARRPPHSASRAGTMSRATTRFLDRRAGHHHKATTPLQTDSTTRLPSLTTTPCKGTGGRCS
ncbi:tea1, partial [Symbiodinium microadriaticum]